MDNQDYLNQISASSAPVGRISQGGGKLSDFLHSKYVIIIGACLGLVVLIAIIGSFFGESKDNLKISIIQLKLHIDHTSDSIKEYQPLLKSSNLRSISSSFQNSLSAINIDITDYITTKYNYKKSSSKETKPLEADAQLAQDALNEELFKAKINGSLDRTYAHRMAFEVEQFKNEEKSIYGLSKDETLHAILNQSLDSLENLYEQFDGFSVTNNNNKGV